MKRWVLPGGISRHHGLIMNMRTDPDFITLPHAKSSAPVLRNAFGACVIVSTTAAFFLIAIGVGRIFDIFVAWSMILGVMSIADRRLSAVPPVLFLVFCFNRLARRVLDYVQGEYSSLPPTSLVVPALGIMLGAIALSKWRDFPGPLRRGVPLIFAAVVYGAAIGVRQPMGTAFEALNWLSPLGFGLFVAWLRPDIAMVQRWIAAVAVISVASMAYGWIQWMLLPPWEAFWVANCGMTSIGYAEAGAARFYGPFADPGAAGTTSAWVAALIIVARALPMASTWPIVIFLSVSSLATKVRSAWIAAVASLAVWLISGRSKHRIASACGLIIVIIGLSAIVPRLPQGQALIDRAATLGDVNNDGSFKGRLAFTVWAVRASMSQPFGHGLGSASLASVRNGDGGFAAFDSGYMEPLYVLGLPGTVLLVWGLVVMLKPLFGREKWMSGPERDVVALCRAIVVGFAFSMLVTNFLGSEQAFLFWGAVGAGVAVVDDLRKNRKVLDLVKAVPS